MKKRDENAGSGWLEISVEVSPEMSEAVADLFNRYGIGGSVIEILPLRPSKARVKIYLPVKRYTSKRKKALEAALNILREKHPIAEPNVREINHADWANAWKKDVVNILAYTMMKMLPELKQKLLPGGHLIAGGILTELAGEFEKALSDTDLNLIERLTEEDWVTMIARRPLQF